MSLIYYFDTWAIIWHGIVPVFLKICTDLQEICSIWAQNCFCYCFWTNIGAQLKKLFRNNNKNNFAPINCKFLANLCKSSENLKQYDVKWWLDYRKHGDVSYSFSCTQLEIFLSKNQHTQRKLLNWCSGKLSKIGHHFSNKATEKLMLSKNVNNKKCSPKFIFFDEDKIEKGLDGFWHRKLTLKVKFGTFRHLPTTPIIKFQ